MLINLSYHPSDRWSEEQKQAARAYGKIVDMTFPTIDPEASIEDVKKMVESFVFQALQLLAESSNEQNAIHVMGEMTFVYQFVKLMHARGVPCLASTTRRMVEENNSGEKYSKFEFVQFRQYE